MSTSRTTPQGAAFFRCATCVNATTSPPVLACSSGVDLTNLNRRCAVFSGDGGGLTPVYLPLSDWPELPRHFPRAMAPVRKPPFSDGKRRHLVKLSASVFPTCFIHAPYADAQCAACWCSSRKTPRHTPCEKSRLLRAVVASRRRSAVGAGYAVRASVTPQRGGRDRRYRRPAEWVASP